MILVTCQDIPGRRVKECLGLVRGNTVRASHAGRDLVAAMKNAVGGEIHEYTKLLAEAREQAIDRMVAEATMKGADAVIGVHFTSSEIATGAAEVLVYGTAVKLE